VQVEVAASLEQGTTDPFDLTIAPGEETTLQVDKEPRIPPSVGQAWTVRSTSGRPFAVERMYEESSPAPHQGVADSMGSPRLSTEWVFPAGSAGAGADEYLVMFNPGAKAAHITVIASGQGQAARLAGLNPLVLAGGSREAIRISDVHPSGIVVLDVRSDVPIVAERAQARRPGVGLSGTIGIGGPVSGNVG
jgi:hypothetical protein